MKLSYLELPIHTKAAIVKIRELHKNDISEWGTRYATIYWGRSGLDGVPDAALLMRELDAGDIYAWVETVKFEVDQWFRLITAFKFMSEEVKTELMAYLLAGNE